MVHDVIVLAQFFNFCFTKIIKIHTIKKNHIFPRKGTLTLTLGMGMGLGGDHLGPQNHKRSQTNIPYENCSRFWDIFKTSKQISKQIFKIYSYIPKTTTNTNTIFEITIYSTKHTKNVNIYLIFSKIYIFKKSTSK